jgi:hypothetical protein
MIDARRFLVYQFREHIPCDLRRRTLPIAAGLPLQVAVAPGLGHPRGGQGGGSGVVVVMSLRHGLHAPPHGHHAGHLVLHDAPAVMVVAPAALAGPREGYFRGNLGCTVPEEVRHREQRAAGDSRGDFCHPRRRFF